MIESNDPNLRCWLDEANDAACDFPIQNLPLGVFTRRGEDLDRRRVGVAIGQHVLDLSVAWPKLCPDLAGLGQTLFSQPVLNPFLASGRRTWTLVRNRVSRWLRTTSAELREDADLRSRCLIPMSETVMHLPVEIGDYTDFYSSKEHATNVGMMFRDPANALLPNWKHLPVGYHGRASSVVVSGTDVHRPSGQTNPEDAPAPNFGPCRLLDFELEVGFITGPGNELGRPIDVNHAHEHIFGMVLVNDWSARDIQKWEYVPLGPFTAKNFATSISPWVVPIDALDPYRVRTPRSEGDPAVQKYLDGAWDWNFDLNLEVQLQSKQMRERGEAPATISRNNFSLMYWNMCQQLAHQTITGCNVRPGDLYASGTVSGTTPDSRGSMLEICWKGTQPLTLPTGEQRKFLADGDTIVMTGACQRPGLPRIGLGEVRGTVLPVIGG
ncbi:MAG: fumarylacetoacetase [Phycisphaerales bacterium]|nr:fumarylacetoacetase [Phycisphaerales bacterium]